MIAPSIPVPGAHRVLEEEARWHATATSLLGPEASLLSVSRWAADSRVYAAGDDVAVIRFVGGGPETGANLHEAESVLRRIGREARYVQHDGYEVLLVPRIEGTPLDRLVPSLSRVGRARMVARTMSELRRLHRLGVAHRDLRPDNVIVDSAGRPNLIDFERAALGTRLGVAAADWLGIGAGGIAPKAFWRFAAFTLEPKTESVGRRLRTKLRSPTPAWASTPPDPELAQLARAWLIAQGSTANAPGQSLAYYAFTYKGWHFPGERPWYLRWDAIRQAVSFEGKRVVELGANMGLLSSFALIHGAREAIGLERNPAIVDAARLVASALGTRAEFQQADLVTTPGWERATGDGDLVVAMSVLHWLPERERVLAFLSRHAEILYEGHDSLEDESALLRSLGFSRIAVVLETERGRFVLHGTRNERGER